MLPYWCLPGARCLGFINHVSSSAGAEENSGSKVESGSQKAIHMASIIRDVGAKDIPGVT
jgi:hypothetical protein